MAWPTISSAAALSSAWGAELSTELAGRRILVTRRPEQAGGLAAGLTALGAEVVEVALLDLAPPSDPQPLASAVATIEVYDWVVFTSANAVQAIADALARTERTLPPDVRVASVGPATSRWVRERLRREPALEPRRDYRAEGLLEAFEPVPLEARRVLLPLSDRARDVLARGLESRGAQVEVVEAYRTVTPVGAGEALAQALAGGVDLVTLASPSAVEALVKALGPPAQGLPVAVMGPVTEHAARAAGLEVRVVAAPATAEGLVESIRLHAEGRGTNLDS